MRFTCETDVNSGEKEKETIMRKNGTIVVKKKFPVAYQFFLIKIIENSNIFFQNFLSNVYIAFI